MKHIPTLAMVIIIGATAIISSCLIGEKKKSDDAVDKAPTQTWPEYFKGILKVGPYSEGYAMLSESGFENHGQVLIYLQPGKDPVVRYAGRSSQKITKSFKLDKKRWENLSAYIAKAKDLKDVETHAMDGVQYTYLHYTKNKDALTEKKKIYMNNPDLASPKPKAHLDLIKHFYELGE